MLCYSFTSKEISDALIKAHNRGVDIKIIIDGGQTDHSRTYADECMNAGIPVYIDFKYAIAHDKVLVFDNSIVETGSFNYTYAAEHRNSENVVFIYSKIMAQQYINRWNERLKTAKKYQ